MLVIENNKIFPNLAPSTLENSALRSSVQREQNWELSERRYFMTSAQISYRQLLETIKHNREQEANWQKQLDETQRHNARQEELSKYATDTSAATSRYTAETSASASRYVGEQRAGASKYSADVNKEVAKMKLDWQKYSDTFRNTLSAFEYKLDKARTDSSVELQEKQIEKYANDISVALQQLELQAQQLGLNAERVEFQNALDRAKKWEAYSKTAMNASQVVHTIIADIQNVFSSKLSRAIDKVGSMLDHVEAYDPASDPNQDDYIEDLLRNGKGGAE